MKTLDKLLNFKTPRYLFIAVVLLLFLGGCVQLDNVGGKGVLKGKITIGPLCPVETVPPQPQCLPTLDTFKAWQLSVYSQDGATKIVNIYPDITGNYQLELPVGKYKMDFEKVTVNRIGGNNLPLIFTILNTDTTRLNINIDTGIR